MGRNAALARALAAGATDAVVALTYDEVRAVQEGSGDHVFVEMTVKATASGRPYL